MSSFFEHLQTATATARESLLAIPQLVRGAQGRISRDTYIAFLGQAYYHVRHTVPLLMACGSRLPMEKEWLREAIGDYIDGETGHQEWILNDIRACGADPEQYRRGTPHPETELMVAYAYDTIARGNPVGFCGMIHVLEGTSVAIALAAAARIQSCLGLPDAAFSYLRSHGTLDQEHTAHFRQLMNRLDDPGDQQSVVHAARMFYRLYGDIFHPLPTASMEEPA